MDANHLVDLYKLDVLPALFRAAEYGASSEGMRVSFVDDENDSSPSIKYNPPYAQMVQTDATFAVTPSADYSFDYCGATSSCSYRTPIRTHLPVIGVEDPVSGRTIHVWLETSSEFTDNDDDGDGSIWVSGGLYSTSNPDWLIFPVNGTDSMAFPAINSEYDFTGRTDVPPALACADSTWNGPSGGYNCLIAWTDKGLAVTNGNSVLYRFFKVNTNGTIAWAPNTVAVRTGSRTAANPALGFFADKLWLAWKDIDGSSATIKVYNSSAAFSWTFVESISAPRAAGGPIFVTRDGFESALLWEESW